MRHTAAMAIALIGGVTVSTGARAQMMETTLLQPSIPIDYDRGRNVSVVDRARPDYDPVGLRRGNIMIFPRIDLGLGATDNVYLTDSNRQSDVYGVVAPSVRANSDWSRHQLLFAGGARLRRYFDETPRNQDEWYLNGLGRFDVGTNYSFTGEAQFARTQEEPFSGEVNSDVAALSQYRRNLFGARGEYRGGRIRSLIGYDYQTFEFSEVTLTSGARFSQENRDRDVHRVTGQFEYAFTPSTAAYGQIVYGRTNYDRQLAPGIANRDSDGVRVIGGVSLDVSGFFRGIVGVGYTWRNYNAPQFRNVDGFSAEAKLEYFPSDLTTYTLALRRVIEDANLGGAGAFFDNRVSVRVDHEARRNLLVNASAEYGRQNYIGTDDDNDIWRVRGGGRYLASRLLGLQLDLSYGTRRRSGSVFNNRVKELQGMVSVVLQR